MTDLNRRIHEALGNCAHEWQYLGKDDEMEDDYKCIRCSEMRRWIYGCPSGQEYFQEPIPNYAGDPRLWWPLLEEMLKYDSNINWSMGWGYGEDGKSYEIENEDYTISVIAGDIGTCVCEAWLKWKGGSGE